MSAKSSISALSAISGLALVALFAARPALAADYVTGDSTTYPTANVRIVPPSNVTPGPIASHLVYLGESRDQAIADARQQGEQPRFAAIESMPAARSGFETYAHVLGLSQVGTQPTRKNPAHS
jgi:hypothetical protein